MTISRADRSAIAEWWRTVDRWFLSAFLMLIGLGLVLSFAASPAVAERIGLDPMHFVERQFFFMVPAFAVLIGVSFLPPVWIRRLALTLLVVGIMMVMATLLFGMEVKGSKRWLRIAGMSVQPSEYLKPAFVVVCAWLFSLKERRPEFSGDLIAIILFGMVAALLVAQPDLGQTMLVGATWGIMFFIAGLSWVWIIGLGGLAAGGGLAAYVAFPHVHARINQFLSGELEENGQIEHAIEAIRNGSWIGQGPGEGTIKHVLADSHTDFIFAVAGEEFGIMVCMLIAAIFGFVVLRALAFAFTEEDGFKRLAVAGLAINFGLQALINMAVNLHLMPPKGMTLPFVSYGGSSLTAVAIGMGMLLALSRKRPEQAMASRLAAPLMPRTA
ncbi:MAG: putative lipid II flippase FtsW [Rhizobiaceae bacterium]|nr:putative lipid II flippase FtsW [Rhizobiaceae bacterium]